MNAAPMCPYCKEAVLAEEPAEAVVIYGVGAQVAHLECSARRVIGSVGHITRQCSCYGGTMEDPPGMTPRQAARLAYETFQWQQRNQSR